jgi:bifunctional non-homologous end joining protein LigD
MPLNWSEVRHGLDTMRFTVRSAPAILARSKAWKGYDEAAKSLAGAIRKITSSQGARKR